MYVIVFLVCITLAIVFVLRVLDNVIHFVLRIFWKKIDHSPCQMTTKTWPHTHYKLTNVLKKICYAIVLLACTALTIVFILRVLGNINLVPHLLKETTGRSPCRTTTKTWPHTYCALENNLKDLLYVCDRVFDMHHTPHYVCSPRFRKHIISLVPLQPLDGRSLSGSAWLLQMY